MSDAVNPVPDIFEGFWTDWTGGRIRGLTLTLCPTSANLLTNSLAMFVTLCGIQLWTIIRYILHHYGASQQLAATPHLNKEQLILRNASSATATARLMLDLAWRSRRSSGKLSLRAYAIGTSAIAYTIFFFAAGIFSTKAISAAQSNGISPVLARSKQCGELDSTYQDIVWGDYSTDEEFASYVQYNEFQSHNIELSVQYAQECYYPLKEQKETPTSCQVLKNATVGITMPTLGECPFQQDMCHSESDTIILDTGNISSHSHFGINARPEDRLTYQRVTKCAVLNATAQTSGWNGSVTNTSDPRPLPNEAYAYYGRSLNYDTEWTYAITNFASFYNNFSVKVTLPYQLDIELAVAQSEPQLSSSDFEPIDGLVQSSADVNLLFLSFPGTYLNAVDDPWFAAHQPHDFKVAKPLFQQRFARDSAISTIGCTEQHNFCTNNGICTGLLGLDQVQNVDSFKSVLNTHQNITWNRMVDAMEDSLLSQVVGTISQSSTPLMASGKTVFGFTGASSSEALPIHQWKLELQYWHSIAMSHLQRKLFRSATGDIAPQNENMQTVVPASLPAEKWFCNDFIVHSNSHQSFSVLALVVIVFLGMLVIIASFCVEPIACIVRRCLNKSAPRRYWDRDDMLELQRSTTRSRWRPSIAPATTRREGSELEPTHDEATATPPYHISDRRSSSQVLSTSDPAFRFVRQHELRTSGRRSNKPDQPAWPLRDSFIAISLDSVSPVSPETPLYASITTDSGAAPQVPATPRPAALTPGWNIRTTLNLANEPRYAWI